MTLDHLKRLGLLVATSAALAACSQSAETPPAPPRAVATQLVQSGETITKASLTGEVRAQVEQSASFRTAGRVVEVLAGVGDHVVAGQALARLDNADQVANLQLADASVRSTQAQLDQAQRSFERTDALFKAGNATRAQADAAQSARDAAAGALAAAQSQQSSAAELVSYVDLTAVSNGVILSRNIETGQVVGAGQAVFTIAEDGPRDAVFNVYEQALTGVPQDVAVALTLIADPAITDTGRVREISPTVNAATGTVRIKVGFANAANAMPLGAAVAASIDLPALQGVALPWAALSRDSAGPAVWVVDGTSQTVSLRPVTVERYLADIVLIGSGLADGDRVVVSGTQLLHPGEAVSIGEVQP